MKKITFWVLSYIVVVLSLPAQAYFIDDSSHFANLGATSISFDQVSPGTSDAFDIGGVLFQGHGRHALRIRNNPCGLNCTSVSGSAPGNQAGGIRGTGFGIYFPFIFSRFFGNVVAADGPLTANPHDEDGEDNSIEEIVLPPLCEEADDCSFDSDDIVDPIVEIGSPDDYVVPGNPENVGAVTDVPEPTALVLLGLGLMGIGLSRRRNLIEKWQ